MKVKVQIEPRLIVDEPARVTKGKAKLRETVALRKALEALGAKQEILLREKFGEMATEAGASETATELHNVEVSGRAAFGEAPLDCRVVRRITSADFEKG